MWNRGSAVVAACLCLALVACGGGGDEPSSAPMTPAGAVVTSPGTAGTPATVGTFRACHKHRDGSLALILLFENRDRALLGGFEGALGFAVEALQPDVWADTGDPVTVDPGVNEHVRQVTVPAGQTPPSELTLEVTTTAAVDETNVLATNEVTIPVPASSCSTA